MLVTVPNLPQFKSSAAPIKIAINQKAFTCSTVPKKELFSEKPNKERTERAIALFNNSAKRFSKVHQKVRGKIDAVSMKELEDFTIKRKARFIEAIQEDPSAALFSILSNEERTTLQAVSSNCVEEATTAEGDLEIIHADYFEDGIDDTQFFLKTNNGERLHIHPARGLKDFVESRTKVRIRGFRIDDELLFDGMSSIEKPLFEGSGIDVLAQPGNPPVIGDQKTVVIMANFKNTTQPSLTAAQVQNTVFTETNNYYKENSYDKVSLSGDVLGWYTLSIIQTCDYYSVRNEVVKEVDADVNFANYSRFIIIAPFGPDCGWAGVGNIGKYIVSTGDGNINLSTSWILSSYADVPVVGHELGHNFGNHHARFLFCGSVSIVIGGCPSVEYGDLYDILGTSKNKGYFNIPHKENIGWLDSSSIQTVTTGGDYTIEPMESMISGVKGLKIQRGVSDYLYIEYRQPIGSDSNFTSIIGTDVFDGALIHTISEGMYYPHLIDATPPTSATTPVLKIGQVFTDPASGVKIAVASKTASNLTASVIMGKTEFVPPAVAITNPLPSTIVDGLVNVAANASDNASGVQKVEFYKANTLVPLAIDFDPPYNASWDTTLEPEGTTYIYAKAYDKSGEIVGVSGNSAESIYVPITICCDLIPPVVVISTPAEGTALSSITTVTASASDNIGIVGVKFKLDGITIDQEDVNQPYSTALDTTTFALNGVHALSAIATDSSGNVTVSAPLSVNFQNPIQYGSVEQITSNPATQEASAIYGDIIIWTDYRNCIVINYLCNTDIYSYDLATGMERQITTNTSSQISPDIYGNTIVWQDSRNGNADIYSYDLATGMERRITTNISSQMSPDIYGNTIVWQDSRNGDHDIYSYDLAANTERRITTNISNRINPAIYGNIVVWSESRSIGNYDIYSYDLNTKIIRPVTNNVSAQFRPAIYNNTIIWQDERDGNPDIYMYKKATDTVAPIVSIISPMEGVIVSGYSIVSALVSDDQGIAKVEFYKDSDAAPFATATTTPYEITLDATTLLDGTHTLFAKAYDTAGNSAASASISITVDNTPPTVSLTAPINNAIISGKTVTFSVSVSDNVGVKQVDYYSSAYSPDTILGTYITAPYDMIWDSTVIPNGTYAFTAKATDTAGNSTISSPIALTILNDSTAPTRPGRPTENSNHAGTTTPADKDYDSNGNYRVYWSVSADAESGIAGYEFQEHLGATGTWKTLATDYNAASNYLIEGRSHNIKYFYRVRAKNNAGLWSAWSYISDGILVDTTAPSAVTVTDDGAATAIRTSLHAKWTASNDVESGVAQYYYYVRQDSTSGTQVASGNTALTEITRTGNLIAGKTYYVGVKAVNNAGSSSAIKYSDGILVQ